MGDQMSTPRRYHADQCAEFVANKCMELANRCARAAIIGREAKDSHDVATLQDALRQMLKQLGYGHLVTTPEE